MISRHVVRGMVIGKLKSQLGYYLYTSIEGKFPPIYRLGTSVIFAIEEDKWYL